MDPNPYASPQSPPPPLSRPESSGSIRYRVFRAPVFSFVLTPQNIYDEARRKAVDFINVEIGHENVVSIVEHPSGIMEPFTVVVWYRVVSTPIENTR
jgi:hypothetical protein